MSRGLSNYVHRGQKKAHGSPRALLANLYSSESIYQHVLQVCTGRVCIGHRVMKPMQHARLQGGARLLPATSETVVTNLGPVTHWDMRGSTAQLVLT